MCVRVILTAANDANHRLLHDFFREADTAQAPPRSRSRDFFLFSKTKTS